MLWRCLSLSWYNPCRKHDTLKGKISAVASRLSYTQGTVENVVVQVIKGLIAVILTVALLGGAPSVMAVCMLRFLSPERWPKVWYCVLIIVSAWCAVAIWYAYETIQVHLAWIRRPPPKYISPAAPMIMAWLTLCLPSFPSLIALIWCRPGRPCSTFN
jgi:hypothetical protein